MLTGPQSIAFPASRAHRPAAIAAAMLASLLLGIAADAEDGEPVDFQALIRPILADHCYVCHGPDAAARQAGLRLDTAGGAAAVGRGGNAAIVPGDSTRSLLLHRVTAPDDADRMPPPEAGARLAPEQIDLLRRWIDQGPEYQEHWAFRAVEPPVPRAVSDEAWPRNGIDRFVLASLDHEAVAASPEADRRTLARRVALDLTGLPPTPEAVDAFVRDEQDDAYERFVDDLLASPHYGERWAATWLDLARYADTKGYEADRRRTMWPYRDWVVRELNDDMPFDQFTIEQLAGDLLPEATVSQRVATAFHRNTMTNDEGGTDDEEFRVAAVVDRVNTTMQIWMGMTMGCAQCHDHKFDPISQEEYYRFFAFFNGTEDSDRTDDQPRLAVPTSDQRSRLETLDRTISELERREQELVDEARGSFAAWVETAARREIAAVDEDGLTVACVFEGDLVNAAGPDAEGRPEGGEPVFADGVSGRGLELRDERHVVLGDLADFESDQAFSYGGWIMPSGNGTMVPVARLDASNAYRGYDLFLHEGRAYVHIIHRWPEETIRVNAREPITPAEWNHVMVTYDGSQGAEGVTIYVDGRPATMEVTHDTLAGTIRTETPLYLGRRHGERHFDGRLDDVRVYERLLSADEIVTIAARGVLAMAATSAGDDPVRRASLERIHLASLAGPLPDVRRELAEQNAVRTSLRDAVPTLPIMRELTGDGRRVTHVLDGGSFLSPSVVVEAGVPAVFHDLPAGAELDRLTLARWLTDPSNPLTARVAVNRYWEQLFGAGLVETADDFGTQGSLPSRPRLLDWLADQLVTGGWSLKSLCRLIVTSSTYRQSSRMRPELAERDPDNTLLARGPRHRLPAEMVRDQTLAVGGLLNRELYGPPVFPPQPDGVWEVVYSDDRWRTAEGVDRHRRALYTFWRRTSPYPSLLTFDAPSREFCVSRRIRTNTPLQALVTLNDPAFVEAAQGLARRLLTEAGPAPAERAAYALRLALLRPARAAELEHLVDLHRRLTTQYRSDVEAAWAMATDPLGPLPEGVDPVEAAAWTVVANVVMNLDEFLVKR